MITFPHANNYQVPLADFLHAWLVTVNGNNVGHPLQVDIPRLNAKEPISHFIQNGTQFSLEYLCRNLVPNGYRNTMQASNEFMQANADFLEEVQTLNPRTGRSVNGARLRVEIIDHAGCLPEVEALFEADCDDLEPGDGGYSEGGQAVDVVAQPDDYKRYIERLTKQIQVDPFTPSFRGQTTGDAVNGWSSRLLTYFWPSPATNFLAAVDKVARLEAEATRLGELLPNWSAMDEAAAVTLAKNIFAWGGVPQIPETITPDNIRRVFNAAIKGALPIEEPLPPMNSGWTKVAAFASAHREKIPNAVPQVIWDSRVATAVTSRLESLFREEGLVAVPACFSDIGRVNVGRGGTRPRALQLSWRNGYKSWAAQYSGSRLLAAIRNELNSNLKLYGKMPGTNGQGNWTARGVEMVLFMDGY